MAYAPILAQLITSFLQAIHLIAFVHRAIAHMCSVVTSAAVPTGVGSTLGNKGGVGLHFQVGGTRLLVVNAHLAAHQTAEKRRNAEFNRIDKMIPVLLEKKQAAIAPKSPNNGRGGMFGIGFAPKLAGVSSASATPPRPDSQTTDKRSGAPTSSSNPEHLLPSVETIVNSAGEIVGEVEYPAGEAHTAPAEGSSPSPTVEGGPPLGGCADAGTHEDGAPAAGDGDVTDAAAAHSEITPLRSVTPSIMENNGSYKDSPNDAGSTDEAVQGEADANKVNALDGTAVLDVPASAVKTLESMADLVVFMGDLNYRIKGNRYVSSAFTCLFAALNRYNHANRKIVSSLVANNMHEVLLHNDQLRWNMEQGLVLQKFTGRILPVLCIFAALH
jgi:hypothetical protein